MKIVNRWKTALAAAVLSAASATASADDIFKGVRGPTNWQLDERVGYAENDRDVHTATQTSILKYWNGKGRGMWAFAIVPYKGIFGPSGSADGLGDITLGAGPRGQTNHLHWLSHAAVTFPTGDSKADVPLGTSRYDVKAGAFFTYFPDPSKKPSEQPFEVDSSIEYTVTGDNPQRVNPPNELAIGVIAGGKIGKHMRLAGGLTELLKDNGDDLTNVRTVFRYTWSPTVHMEVIADHTIAAENMPHADSITALVRWNIGKR